MKKFLIFGILINFIVIPLILILVFIKPLPLLPVLSAGIILLALNTLIFVFSLKVMVSQEQKIIDSVNCTNCDRSLKEYDRLVNQLILNNHRYHYWFGLIKNFAQDNPVKMDEPVLEEYLQIDKIDKLIEKKTVIIKELIDQYDPEVMQTVIRSFQAMMVVVDVYHKIPYINTLLKKIPEKTEEAAMNLLNQFDLVSSENKMASSEANRNIERIKNGIEGISFEAIISNSKEAINRYEILNQNLMKMTKDNSRKLRQITGWVDQINGMLLNIEDISDINKIISINSSIEAAHMGEKGKGFQVLATEIRKLNHKTTEFTQNIKTIMNSFTDFIGSITQDWENETRVMLDNLNESSKNTEDILKALIQSYEVISSSYFKLTESNQKVDKSLNQILESLQFQDITRQQIENVIKILNGVKSAIQEESRNYNILGIDLDKKSDEMKNRIRDELISKVTVDDERGIIRNS